MALFIRNVAPVVSVAWLRWLGELAFGLAKTSGVLHISVITQVFVHFKLSSISQVINGKSRDLQKIPKYFNGTITSNVIIIYCGI